MTGFLTAYAKTGCRRSFSRHSLHVSATRAVAVLSVAIAQTLFTTSVTARSNSRPNFVFFLVDDN